MNVLFDRLQGEFAILGFVSIARYLRYRRVKKSLISKAVCDNDLDSDWHFAGSKIKH